MNFSDLYTPTYFMKEAIKEANKALEHDEVPIGAVVVSKNQIIARAYNQTRTLNDSTAHAEMLAITAASNHLGSRYLQSCELYVTLEPCVMCAGALYWSRIGVLHYSASDPKVGFMKIGKSVIHPKTIIQYGACEQICQDLLQDFFKGKR